MIWEYLKLSIDELINNKLRSFLSLIGIVIGVAVVFIIFSISDITNTAITNEISGTNGVFQIYYVEDKEDTAAIFRQSFGFSQNSPTQGNHYDVEDIELLQSLEGIAGAMGNFNAKAFFKVEAYSTQTQIERFNDEFLDYHELKILEGKSISDYPKDQQLNTVLVTEPLVQNYLEMTNQEVIGKEMIIKNRQFTIVGVIEGTANSGAVTILSEEGYDLMFSQNTLSAISVKIKPGYPLQETAQLATDQLNEIHGYDDAKAGYALEDLSFLIDQIKVVTGILSLVMGIIASISLLVAGIGVMNIMLVSVVERTREIGVKRAIGASKTAIQFQFIVESCLLTFIGGVIGVLIGVGVIQLTLSALNMEMGINLGYVIFALLFSISLGLMFGYLPSKRAANLNIIEAIQSE